MFYGSKPIQEIVFPSTSSVHCPNPTYLLVTFWLADFPFLMVKYPWGPSRPRKNEKTWSKEPKRQHPFIVVIYFINNFGRLFGNGRLDFYTGMSCWYI